MSRSLWHESRDHSLIRTHALVPTEGPSACRLQAAYSLISTGTERLVATGGVPGHLKTPMRVPHMQGTFDFPLQYGYSWTGTVVEGPSHMVGKAYHLMHPHQDLIQVDAATLFEIPAEVPLKRAALASNMETAVNAVWDARLSAGDRVLVVGFGMIGALVARLAAQFPGTQVWVSEKDPLRRQLAAGWGFLPWQEAPDELIPDLAFHTSGTSQGLQTSLEAVGHEGKVIELSWYGQQQVSLLLGGSFHTGRKQILSSQVSHIPGHKTPAWNYARRKHLVFHLLKQAVWDLHLTHEIPFETAPAFFHQLRQQPPQGLGWVIRYT